MIDNDLMRQLLRELVAIDSVNPSLVPGARGEAAAAGFLRDFLRRQGIAAELQEAAPGRPNVVAQIDRKSTRLNSSHSQISYAVFCLKKKKNKRKDQSTVLSDCWRAVGA